MEQQTVMEASFSGALLDFVKDAFSWVTPSLVATSAMLYFLCTQVRRVVLRLDFAKDEKKRNVAISLINFGVGAVVAIFPGFLEGVTYGSRLKMALIASAVAMGGHEVVGKFALPWIASKFKKTPTTPTPPEGTNVG